MLNRQPFCPWATRRWLGLAAALLIVPAVRGQSPPQVSRPAEGEVLPAYAKAALDGAVLNDPAVVPASCVGCSGGPTPVPAILGGGGSGPCACGDTCGSCGCKPGKTGCCPVEGCGDGCFGRFLTGVARCLCCPDPCYESHWVTVANSAFFMDTVRPRTTTRFRWDAGRDLAQPDRAEFFWARVRASGGGRGPRFAETGVDYDELSLYQEVASGNFAFFIQTDYRSVYPDVNAHHANFGDMSLGTKSLFIDCELLQMAFQFKTYIPTGSSQNGLGTGHTALEPSLLAAIKLNADTYLQSQLAYWIPIGGDRTYEGAIWHYHLALNHLWWRKGALQLIGTSEINTWTFTDGALTEPVTRDRGLVVPASGETYVSAGGGWRLVFCENCDLGFGATFAVTDDHFAQQLYRTELRIRY